MITVRKGPARGHAQHGWLDSYHTFSFANYHDPRHMGWGNLRVINEDWIAPGMGFGMHPHRDMEILTYVLEGTVEHSDSLGTRKQVRPGEIQRMTAGSGIVHSEYNPSESEPLHLLQIWILPERSGLQPGYEQRELPSGTGIRALASADGGDGVMKLHADAGLYRVRLTSGEEATQRLDSSRRGWLQVTRGTLSLNGEPLTAGDGAAIADEDELRFTAKEDAEALLFDLA